MESDEFLKRVARYISHSQHVWAGTHNENKRNLHYAHILERIAFCKNSIQELHKLSGKQTICKIIYIIKQPLKEILPSETNCSYQSSLIEYNEIIAYCEEILKIKNSYT